MSDFLLSLKDVSLAFGGPQVLDRVSLSIHRGLRAALTGRNGEGKSTLMKVIAGTLEPDAGEIVRAPGLKVVYVGQGVEDLGIDRRIGVDTDTIDNTISMPTDAYPRLPPPKNKKLSYNEQRELAALPDRIDALEKEIAAIEADLVAGRIYMSDRLAPAQAELEQLVERWAELEERQMKCENMKV